MVESWLFNSGRQASRPILWPRRAAGVGKNRGQSIAARRTASSCACRWAACAMRPRSAATARTYIGSMPANRADMSKAASTPLFLLDEVDKMSMAFRGDPHRRCSKCSSPEQNSTSNESLTSSRSRPVGSDVRMHGEQPEYSGAPVDRMEVIRLPGTPKTRRMNIGRRYLGAKR